MRKIDKIRQNGVYGNIQTHFTHLNREQGILLCGVSTHNGAFPYNKKHIDLIKGMQGQFLPESKQWFVPIKRYRQLKVFLQQQCPVTTYVLHQPEVDPNDIWQWSKTKIFWVMVTSLITAVIAFIFADIFQYPVGIFIIGFILYHMEPGDGDTSMSFVIGRSGHIGISFGGFNYW